MKPSTRICDTIRCPKFWPFDHRCQVTGMVPGHMQYCPENRLHTLEEITEAIAELEHLQWRHWTRYMLANMTPENVERWKRQCGTPYSRLTESEKVSDRKWARKVVAALNRNKMVGMNDVPSKVIQDDADIA